MITLPTPTIEAPDAVSLTTDQVGEEIMRRFHVAKRHRYGPIETLWDSMYEMYRASLEDLESTKRRSFYEAGNIRDWSHKVNTGKTFEVTETLVAYLKGATFPSDDWFDVKGAIPNLAPMARIVKALTKQKLDECVIRDVYDVWLRRLIIYGVATKRIGWRNDTQRTYVRGRPVNRERATLDITVMSPYDVWLDTTAPLNMGGIWARLRLTRQELIAMTRDEYFTVEEAKLNNYNEERNGDTNVNHDSSDYTRGQDDIIEYYGPLLLDGVHFCHVHAVFLGGVMIRLADSEYECGSPYHTTVLLENRDSIYGMSLLHPNLGALHVLNVLTNSRLDNIAIRIDNMWTAVKDGVLDPSTVRTAPGAVFEVAQHGSLQPIDLGPPNFTVTYQEESVQSAAVDRNTATGPLIGMGQPRGGERVTASEINAVRDSGGNRLGSMHMHVEDAGTIPFLGKVFKMLQQYYVTPELVRLFDPDTNQDAFYEADPEYLHYPYKFTALGANYVVERQRNLAELMQLLDISARVPQMSEQLNYAAIMEDILRQMRFTNPQRFLKTAAPAPDSPDVGGEPVDLSASVGGELATQAAQAQVAEDGGAQLVGNLGVDTSEIDPATLQQATQPMVTPQ